MIQAAKPERILIVDEDQDTLYFLGQQILEPMGYKVATASDGATAIQQAIQFGPDIIIASLTLPGLSGKDLLVALRSRGTQVPMLVTAPKGKEADAIQAFRLGAHDYLTKPLREAEVVSALERVVKEIRLRHEHRQLAEQLAESNRQLERRVRELTTLFGLGKTVTSTTNQGQLFSKLIEGSLYIAEADMGWVLVRSEDSDQLILRAERNLPAGSFPNLQQAWDDGVSALVMLSGETLAIQGEGLAKFKLAQFCSTALIAPIKVKDQPIGVICVAREHERHFTERQQVMLEAVADYASISLVNARLFQALEERAKRLEREIRKSAVEVQNDQMWLGDVHRSLRAALAEISELTSSRQGDRNAQQLNTVRRDIESVLERVDNLLEAKESH
ncbi:MAG: response regulator [Anaerolineales bacterium]|nr:response regulator [Anaerolineales bacterium]TFH35746.1 MAG: response regulator [Anaerolineales bacterium]